MNWTLYLIQANIYLLVFYGLYKTVLANETYFKLNRAYLLLSGILAIAVPFIRIDWFAEQPANQQLNINWANLDMLLLMQPIPERAPELQWGNMVAVVYLLGIVIFMLVFLGKLFGVLRMLAKQNNQVAFSFFKHKKIDANLPQSKVIDRHEDVHIKQWHSADVLFFELLGVFAWFNPIIYLYKKEIKNVHEYLADEVASQHQGDKQDYAMLLLHQAMGVKNHPLTNTFFNQSTTKKRIAMLFKNRSRKVAFLKYGLAFPLLALALMLSSSTLNKNEKLNEIADKIPLEETANTVEVKEIISNPVVAITKKAKEIKQQLTLRADTDSVKVTYNFMAMDNPPTYPGGMEKFYKYIADNLRYPKEAQENNLMGIVFVSFVIETDGTVSDAKILRSAAPSLDAEALRIINNSQKWIAGTEKGKPVRAKFTMPISFRFQGAKPTSNSAVSKALYVVDEKLIDTPFNVNSIKADDIKEISVLKDTAATNLYGEKGKNGVVKIYTKEYAKKHPLPAAKKVRPTSNYDVMLKKVTVMAYSGEDIKSMNTQDVLKTLQGKVTGVKIDTAKKIGTVVDIKDITPTNALYVIDGIVSTKAAFDKISKENINNMEVLKDNAATALYGDKGKNGVILITTKKKKKSD